MRILSGFRIWPVLGLAWCLCLIIAGRAATATATAPATAPATVPAAGPQIYRQAPAQFKDRVTIVTHDGSAHAFTVDLALTPAQLMRGMMFRTDMARDAGMLFLFNGDEAERSFWMKNTLIPLDIIFIRSDGVIHHIHHNARPHDLTRITSNGPVAAVLEIKGGTSAALGLRPGDRLKNSFFGHSPAQ